VISKKSFLINNKVMKYLKLFFLVITINLLMAPAHGAQLAVVTTSQAIIYADQSLNSPIGFVRSGRRLMVGSVARGRGTVVPVVVAGKIAYIQVKDVALSNSAQQELERSGEQSRQLEHIVEENVYHSTFNYDLTENNFIIFGPAILSPGTALEQLNDVDNTASQNLSQWSLSIEHRPILSPFSFNVGLSYFSLSQSNFQLQSLSGHGTFNYNLIRLPYLNIGPMAGLYLSGDFRFKTTELATRGGLVGYKIGGQARLAPRQKIGAAFEAGLQYLIPIGTKPVGGSEEIIDLNKIGGLFISAALVYRL
jgi:hypothetical protein